VLVAAVLVVRELTARQFVEVWSRTLPDRGNPIALSSPNVATLGGVPAVVVGDRAGHVYAFSLADGHALRGWPAKTHGIPVDSTPSVAALQAGGGNDTVFVGIGNSSTPHAGGYEAFNSDGTERWFVAVKNPATDPQAGSTSAVRASLAIGDLQGKTPDVVAPSLGQEEYAIDASSGATLPGFPWFTSDSGFATPAIADLYGNSKTEIVEGGDQSPGVAYGVHYSEGGHLRVLASTGNAGMASPAGGLDCEYNTNQVVQSSPAVGGFLAGGAFGIVVGTGTFWPHASDTDKLLAFGVHCNLVWEASLDGATLSSPALADVQSNGTLDVIEGTDNGKGDGSVYALNGATGRLIWSHRVRGAVIGGVVTAELANGHQDVIVPTTEGAFVLSGRTGEMVTTLEVSLGLQNSPLVTDDPNGAIGITLAGYNGYNEGQLEHFEIAGSHGPRVDDPGAWPMFHHDPRLTGDAGPARPSAPGSAPAPP
jgi:outer membrane protein assembly factor BamB